MKISLNYPKSAVIGCFSKGLKDEFERAGVNEQLVFEPLKVYYIPKLFKFTAAGDNKCCVLAKHSPRS